MRDRDVVIVSTQDYDDLRTRKQRWAERLAEFNRVLYIESQMHWVTLLRTWPEHRERWRRCGKPPRRVAENLWVWTPPIVLPCFQMWTALARLNNWWLSRRLKQAIRALGFETNVLWLYTPYSAGLIDAVDPQRVIYECVDDFTAARGLIRPATVKALEDATLRRADLTVVTADRLAERLRNRAVNLRVSSNACDVATFAQADDPETPIPSALAALPRPIYGFVGAVAYWVDLDLLAQLALSNPEASVVLVGPVRVDTRRYRGITNLILTGRQPVERIPEFLRGFDVCLNPYKHDDLSYGASPLKLYEYLASGKPVVSTDMPEARRFEGIVRIARNTEEFIAHCRDAATELPQETRERRARQAVVAQGQTWDARFAEIETWLDQLEDREQLPHRLPRLILRRPPERQHVVINGLQVTGPELGGGYTYLTQLLRHMIPAHPETRFTVLATRSAAGHFDWGFPNLGVHTLPNVLRRGAMRVLFERLLIGRTLDRLRPDVYFLPYGVLPRRKCCPEVITYQNLYFLHAQEFAEWESPRPLARLYERLRLSWLARFLRSDARRADRIVAVSETARQDLTALLRIDLSLTSVTHEGPGMESAEDGDSGGDAERMRQLGLPEKFYLSVGAIAPNKNLPALIDAYAALRATDSEVPSLVLAGSDWNGFSQTIDAKIRALRLAPHVHRLGFVPATTMSVLYRRAVAAVQLSGCESFGLPALEAMSAGCPVICADRSGLAEITGDAAVQVDPHDRIAVADALKRMVSDQAWRAQWIRRGRQRSREFNWGKTAESTYGAIARAANWKAMQSGIAAETATTTRQAPQSEPIMEEV